MTRELDLDEIDKIRLTDEALDCATEAATQAHVAGLDPSDCLEAGIKAYLWAIRTPIEDKP